MPDETRLQPGDKPNLKTIVRAARNSDLGLLRVTRKGTDPPVHVTLLVAFHKNSDDEIETTPLAELFSGNPYELYEPPA